MGSGCENPLSWSFEAWLRNTRRTGKCKEQTICQMESFWLKEFIWMSDSRPHFTFPSWRAQWSYFFFRPNTKWERHLFWIHKSHQPFLFPVNLRALTEASRLWTRQSHPNFKNCTVAFELAWRCSGNLPRSRNAKTLLRHSDMCLLPLLNRLVERVAMKRPGRANCASTQCQMRLDQLIWTGLLVGLRLLSFALVEVTAVTGWLAD